MARLNEGYSLDDFKQVIEKKVNEWKGTEMEKYLRPETLFGTKFENYLNQKIAKKKQAEDIITHGHTESEYEARMRKAVEELYDEQI